MKVLLVNPPSMAEKPHFKMYATFPNGLLYMAAVLEKNGHQVQIYDANVDDRKIDDFKDYSPLPRDTRNTSLPLLSSGEVPTPAYCHNKQLKNRI